MGIALKTISRIIIDLSSEANNKNSKTFLPPFFYLSKKGCEAWRKNWLLHFRGASDLSWFLEIKVRRGFECLIEEVYEEIHSELETWKKIVWAEWLRLGRESAEEGGRPLEVTWQRLQTLKSIFNRCTPFYPSFRGRMSQPRSLANPKPILRTSVL